MENMQTSVAICLRTLTLAALLLSVPLALTGCDMSKNMLKMDRAANLEKQDFRDAMAPRLPEVEKSSSKSSIPSLQSYVASGSDKTKDMPLVSISVNQSVPLRDVFFELAGQADYDIELDPRIVGSVIFTARERPFDQVVQRLSDMAGLRYSFEEGFLRIELDTPYNKLYKIDYLSYVRSNKSSIRNEVAVVSGDGAADTGSGFSADSESESNFWSELENNLAQIIAGATSSMITSFDPRITSLERVANVVPIGVRDASGQIQVSPPNSVLRVDSLPVGGGTDSVAGDGGTSMPEATFAVNRQAGLINIFSTKRIHDDIDKYLRLLRKSVTAQVLIEAKILEVSLNDSFSLGIDWRAMNAFSDEFGFNYYGSSGKALLDALDGSVGDTNTLPSGASPGSSLFAVGYAGNDVQTLVRAVSEYGTVRALASPRMTVLNNQSAVLNVATNQVFFEIDIDVTTDDGVTQTDIDSTIRNVPEGVLVNVQPSIDLENNTISLALRPTITRIVSFESDPAVQYITADAGITGVESLIPELNVQEIDSVIQVNSGQPIVMGGLLQDRVISDQHGVPVLSEMPIVGGLFRQHTDNIQKTELVIFLKATILESPSNSVHNTDRDLYRKFSSDRRPFKF